MDKQTEKILWRCVAITLIIAFASFLLLFFPINPDIVEWIFIVSLTFAAIICIVIFGKEMTDNNEDV